MSACKKTYSFARIGACIIMIFSLCWLTISAPFIYRALHHQNKSAQIVLPETNTDDSNSDLSDNMPEEESESGKISLSEYLHDATETSYLISSATRYKHHADALYIAFHGELLTPPPEV